MNQDRIYDYIKMAHKWFSICTMWSISFLLVLWMLDYKTAFFVLLVMEVLSDIGFYERIHNLEEKVGLR